MAYANELTDDAQWTTYLPGNGVLHLSRAPFCRGLYLVLCSRWYVGVLLVITVTTAIYATTAITVIPVIAVTTVSTVITVTVTTDTVL
jgi:hypothetical protein